MTTQKANQPTDAAKSSLLERAAVVYDFNAAFRKAGSTAAAPARSDGAKPLSAAPDALVAGAAMAPPRRASVERHRVSINRDRLLEQGLLVPGGAVGLLAEEFRLVKRQLLLTARAIAKTSENRGRIILVSSANPEEGKTYCALNLAISMAAEKDVEVLLVDADFAKADVMRRLGLAEGPGLLDALADPGADVESFVMSTDVPQLSLLSTGTRTTQDTELLASERTPALLNTLLEYDRQRIIIMDSPPALAASTGATLALHVGQVMMVVRADRTSSNDLRDAVCLLDGCAHIQLLLNAATYAAGGRRFGNYYPQELPT
ncbi:MAG: AAA family ATPase [Sphingomonas sp.]|jgi:Mrp family chromosome partitioning ATPase